MVCWFKCWRLSDTNFTNIDGKQIPMRSGVVHDKSQYAPTTIFGDICSTAKNDQAFQCTNLSLK